MTYLYSFMLFSCRRRREYLKLDFEKLLEEKGIDSNLIIPRNPNSSDEHVITPCSPLSPYLPLEVGLLQSCLWHFALWLQLHLACWGSAPLHTYFSCIYPADLWQRGVWLPDSRRLACPGQCWRITWSKTFTRKSTAAYRWRSSF